ncbi:SSI family serine proteinase inhibitor [Streptacidiphilus sp. EB129]|uniref:SSI family serine proteinase inhibitor n=1 Tax=Streptacidiphilus sp. EB129 TaxID=3156262 RepID=UPI003514EA80
MRRIRNWHVTAAVLGAACLTALAAPQAMAAEPDPTVPSLLVMTVANGTQDAQTTPRSTVLICGAATEGDHPDGASACATLQADGLSFTAPPALQILCADIVQPVTVTAEGFWDGAPVFYQQTYTNPCLMWRATGALFAF